MELLSAITAAVFIGLISLLSLWVLLAQRERFQDLSTALIAFAAGALLGDVFWHLLAEYIEENGYSDQLVVCLLAGILASLILEAAIHCSHDTGDGHSHKIVIKNRAIARMNLLSDALHNFLDGIALGASFLAGSATGWASALAIAFHEIPQELADNSILLNSGWSKKKVILANFSTALTSILGVVSVFILGKLLAGLSLVLIPFAAGQFIYIATADLLPEIHHKSGWMKYTMEISMFVLGMMVMYILTLGE